MYSEIDSIALKDDTAKSREAVEKGLVSTAIKVEAASFSLDTSGAKVK